MERTTNAMPARTRLTAWMLALLMIGLCGSVRAIEHSPLFDARFNYISNPPDIEPEVVGGRWQLTNTIVADWLQGLDSYRSTRVPLTSGVVLRSREGWERPTYVAGTDMFVDPAVDGGSDTYSPDALIGDNYYSFEASIQESASLTAGSPTATIDVSAIDRALPASFGLLIDGDNRFQLDTAAAQGATAITVRRMGADCTINDGDTAIAGNRFPSQAATMAPIVDGLFLVGDPDPVMNNNPALDAGRKYALDAIATNALGVQIRNTVIGGFQGHGIIVLPVGNSDDFAGAAYPLTHEMGVIDTVFVERCLSGVTIGVNDFLAFTIYVSACRDYGIHTLSGTNTTGNVWHAYGVSGTAVDADGAVRVGYIEGETSGRGIDLGGTGSQVASMRAYGNTITAVRIYGNHAWFGSILSTHAIADSYCLEISEDSDHNSYDHGVYTSSGTCNGILVGISNDRTLKLKKVHATVLGSGGEGATFNCDLAGTDIDVTVDSTSFTTEVYFSNDVDLTGCTLKLRGPTAAAIRWADGTTGTFGTPNTPAAVSSANEVQILDY
jgi:hypothetical protein